MDKRIESPNNELYKTARKLATRKGREKTGLFLCEGWRASLEALRAGVEPVALLISDEVTEEENRALSPLISSGVDVRRLPVGLFRNLTDVVTPQHVLLVARMARPDWRSFDPGGTLLVVDRVQDPGNLGTILRTWAAAGFQDVALLRGTVDPYSPKVLRAMSGGLFHLRLYGVDEPGDLLQRLRKEDYRLVCADVRGDNTLFGLNHQERTALVIGNEGAGIEPELLEAADLRVGIPMPGGVESLNAAVAAGLLIYELVRKGPLAGGKQT